MERTRRHKIDPLEDEIANFRSRGYTISGKTEMEQRRQVVEFQLGLMEIAAEDRAERENAGPAEDRPGVPERG